jgi:3-deoxy-D-manno-octulosonate 8-phosphate phosphatase (KDO 8-P phosphatase)
MALDENTKTRIRAVRLIAMDVDGVLTDGMAFYGSGGFEGLFFNVQDGSAIKWLHRAGLQTALITGREIEAVRTRAGVLDITLVYQSAKVKLDAYDQLRRDTGLSDAAVCYVGDDLPDLPVMRRVGLAVAVSSARPEVKAAAHIVTEAPGGRGAVRELAELVLRMQGLWGKVTERYFQD